MRRYERQHKQAYDLHDGSCESETQLDVYFCMPDKENCIVIIITIFTHSH